MENDAITCEFMAERWPLTRVSFGETIQTSGSRRATVLRADEGEFIAKINDHPGSREEELARCAVFDFLTARQFAHSPSLLKTRIGASVSYESHRTVLVMEYLSGQALNNSPESWRELGFVARKLNDIQDFPGAYGVPTSSVIEELKERAQAHPQKRKFLELVDQMQPLLRYPQRGLVHGEINLANAARRKDGVPALVDWDEAGTGATVLEPGYPLITNFLTEDLQFRADLAAAFYGTYYLGVPASDERDLLFRSALLHAMRYVGFGNKIKRWERLCYATANQNALMDQIFGRQ